MAKSFKDLVRKTGNKKTRQIAKKRTAELLKSIKMKSNEMLFIDDKDISINISGHGNIYQFSIYNDKTDKAVATQINREQLKRLADFINKYLENN